MFFNNILLRFCISIMSITLVICNDFIIKDDHKDLIESFNNKCTSKYNIHYFVNKESIVDSCKRGGRLFYLLESNEPSISSADLYYHCKQGCSEAYMFNSSLNKVQSSACSYGCGFMRTLTSEHKSKMYELSIEQVTVYKPIKIMTQFYSAAYNILVTQTMIYWTLITDRKVYLLEVDEELHSHITIHKQRSYREVMVNTESTFNWKVIYHYERSQKIVVVLMLMATAILLWQIFSSMTSAAAKHTTITKDAEKATVLDQDDCKLLGRDILAPVHSNFNAEKLLIA